MKGVFFSLDEEHDNFLFFFTVVHVAISRQCTSDGNPKIILISFSFQALHQTSTEDERSAAKWRGELDPSCSQLFAIHGHSGDACRVDQQILLNIHYQ